MWPAEFQCNYKFSFNLKSDGVVVPNADMEVQHDDRAQREVFRLASFSKHIPNLPTLNLVRAGFYAIDESRVMCFSCHNVIEDFQADDDPFSPDWHRSTCSHLLGSDSGNIPLDSLISLKPKPPRHTPTSDKDVEDHIIKTSVSTPVQHKTFLKTLNLYKESDRRNSFTSDWPMKNPVFLQLLASKGFFYLGEKGRTKCFSCGVILSWSDESADIDRIHEDASAGCRMLNGDDDRNLPLVENKKVQTTSGQLKRPRLSGTLSFSGQMDAPESIKGFDDITFQMSMQANIPGPSGYGKVKDVTRVKAALPTKPITSHKQSVQRVASQHVHDSDYSDDELGMLVNSMAYPKLVGSSARSKSSNESVWSAIGHGNDQSERKRMPVSSSAPLSVQSEKSQSREISKEDLSEFLLKKKSNRKSPANENFQDSLPKLVAIRNLNQSEKVQSLEVSKDLEKKEPKKSVAVTQNGKQSPIKGGLLKQHPKTVHKDPFLIEPETSLENSSLARPPPMSPFLPISSPVPSPARAHSSQSKDVTSPLTSTYPRFSPIFFTDITSAKQSPRSLEVPGSSSQLSPSIPGPSGLSTTLRRSSDSSAYSLNKVSFAETRQTASISSPINLARSTLPRKTLKKEFPTRSKSQTLQNSPSIAEFLQELDPLRQNHSTSELVPETSQPKITDLQLDVGNYTMEPFKTILVEQFPCSDPVRPDMGRIGLRLETFTDSWPYYESQATITEVAEAGLFSAGDKDLVECWYCGAQAVNWSVAINPWAKHCFISPTCQFLLRNRGSDYVQEVLSNGIWIRANESTSQCVRERVPSMSRPNLTKQQIRDLVSQCLQSDVAKDLVALEYDRKTIISLMKERIQKYGEGFRSVDDALDALEEKERDLIQLGSSSSSSDEEYTLPEVEIRNSPEPPSEPVPERGTMSREEEIQIQQELYRLREEKRCKVCLDRNSEMIFIPCGHICACRQCTQSLHRCPVCRQNIVKSWQTYTS